MDGECLSPGVNSEFRERLKADLILYEVGGPRRSGSKLTQLKSYWSITTCPCTSCKPGVGCTHQTSTTTHRPTDRLSFFRYRSGVSTYYYNAFDFGRTCRLILEIL
jgi:hypothetical protein